MLSKFRQVRILVVYCNDYAPNIFLILQYPLPSPLIVTLGTIVSKRPWARPFNICPTGQRRPGGRGERPHSAGFSSVTMPGVAQNCKRNRIDVKLYHLSLILATILKKLDHFEIYW